MNDFPLDVTYENGYSLLHEMGTNENPEFYEPIIRKLIERGSDINMYRYGSEVWWDLRPIAITASHGNIGAITFLLQYGPEVQDTRALALSVRNDNLECISILLETGAHPHGPPRNFHYPIDRAVVHKRLQVVKTLNEASNT